MKTSNLKLEIVKQRKRLINLKSRMILVLVLLAALLISPAVTAQENASGRIPDYTVPYVYPSVDNIKDVIDRVWSYYDSTCDLQMIDTETGEAITDFSKPNKNARVPDGFACEWSYTNGVVLSAFEYIHDVTGDSTYFAYNTRFYDYVVKTLPYIVEIKEKYDKREKYG